mmetsp:Transcript_50510/g.83719  ORF Transcript_50510/g.83719 Transcript_50510/m.83719 type:complete len:87 (+) Transcript_50510:865-1125(+)
MNSSRAVPGMNDKYSIMNEEATTFTITTPPNSLETEPPSMAEGNTRLGKYFESKYLVSIFSAKQMPPHTPIILESMVIMPISSSHR